MHRQLRNPAGESLTTLILDLFRVNNLILGWGDRLVAPLGLTSARWQVLGAVGTSERPQPVAWLARDLGSSRQNVQRIVNDLAQAGLVGFAPNPHHKRAQLVVLTEAGAAACAAALALYDPQANALAEGIAAEDLAAAQRVLSTLRARLNAEAAET